MDRVKVLKMMQASCTSSKDGFKKTERLETIAQLAKKAGYSLVHDGKLSKVYGKHSLKKLANAGPVCVISTHVDTVPKKLFCELDEETMTLRGTFDNTITNAAAAVLMLEGGLPDNVLVAFNGDEETGHCGGAREVVAKLTGLGVPMENIHVAALDVTNEGFHRNMLYTIENVVHAEFGGQLVRLAQYMDNAGAQETSEETAPKKKKFHAQEEQKEVRVQEENIPAEEENVPVQEGQEEAGRNHWFCYAPPDGKYPESLHIREYSRGPSWLDEGLVYGKLGTKAFSFCIPCGNGNMHGEDGVEVELPVYHGYIDSLGAFMNAYVLGLSPELEQKARDRSGYVRELEALSAVRREKEAELWKAYRESYVGIPFDEEEIPGQMSLWEEFGGPYDQYAGSREAGGMGYFSDDPEFCAYLDQMSATYEDFDEFLCSIEIPDYLLNLYYAEEMEEMLWEYFSSWHYKNDERYAAQDDILPGDYSGLD